MSPRLFPELTNKYGFVVIMYPNDHLPAHVHVYRGDKVARINIEAPELDVMDSYGFRERELSDICGHLRPYRNHMLALWNQLHPDNLYSGSEE